MGSLNFGKDTAEDKYASFLVEYEEYVSDDLSIDRAQRVATSPLARASRSCPQSNSYQLSKLFDHYYPNF
jgi:hypothetical protein